MRERGSHATIVLHSVPNPLEYGVVVTDDEGNIKRFLEKPSWGEVFSDHANTGIYVIEPKVLDHIKEGANADWSQDVFPTMLRRHEPLHGIVVDDYWCDIGSIQSYMQANWDALDGKVRCHITGRREGNVWMGEGVEIGIGVQLDGPAFIGDEVKLKAGAHINEHGVIDRYSVIDDNTKVSNSVVWPHSYIGERCRLRQAIVCRNVTIKNDSLLEENSVIADECVLGRGSQIRAGVKIWPSKTVEPGSTVNESVIWAGEWRSGLFSSYGLGGLINVELTPEFCARLGAAFGATLAKGACVVVGQDHARSSRMIKRAIVSGIVSAGAKARDVRELPVPVTQWATLDADCAAGIHVLVSPLDQRSADIRFFDSDGLQIDKRAERKLENLLFREDFRRAGFYEMGDIEYGEPIAGYTAHLFKSVDGDIIRNALFRVLIDYDYSDASAVLPAILNELGRDHHSAQRRHARGWTPSHGAGRDGADQQDGAGRRRMHDQPDGRTHHHHRRQGRGAHPARVPRDTGHVVGALQSRHGARPRRHADVDRRPRAQGGRHVQRDPGRPRIGAPRVGAGGDQHRLGRRGRIRLAGTPGRI